MDEINFFDSAKQSVTSFFEREFPNFPPLILSTFLSKFNDLLNYSEEGKVIRPKIVFTDNIDAIVKTIPKINLLTVFEDRDSGQFLNRLKSLLAITKRSWFIFVEIKDVVRYGLVISLTSIKDKSALNTLLETTSLKDKPVNCIVARTLNLYSMSFHSTKGNNLLINLSLDTAKTTTFANEVKEFVDATFSKLRTTQHKLQDMKNMYLNIFTNVMNDVNGTICVIVDKDYVFQENGIFADGIWLKEPISFSKLFTQSKSYNEEKLQAYADLLFNMVNFDGITILDNKGRLRAYNVFVESNTKRVSYIVGGARKRAAYYILGSKRKGLVGVYFQSHEGEVFYRAINNPPQTKKVTESQITLKL